MKNLFNNYYDKILIILAVVFMAGIIFLYIWGVEFLFQNFNKATELGGGGGGGVHFNIEKAKSLNLQTN